MNLDIQAWKPFITSRLFPVMENGKANQQMLDDGNECFYVGAKRDDNGVMIHCQRDESLITKGNCIVFICNGQGSVGFANYMDVDFIGTTDIVAGYNEHLNEFTGTFLATVYSQERPKYSFGRKWKTHLRETEVMLPIQHNSDGSTRFDISHRYSDEGYIPDWQFMEDYIKSLHHKPLTTKNKVGQAPELNVKKWREFRVGDFFDIHPTKAIDGVSADDCVGFGVPLIVNSAEYNGVAGLCDLLPTEDGGIITFSDTTDGNTFFYQPNPFIGFAHVQGMYPKTRTWTEGELLFFCTMLMFDARGRYNYGRKMRRDTIAEVMLKLPVDADGLPDWQFMEEYIKALPYGDRLEG
ncbi:MAG: restriction endonuclease subunit S [Firmicutes bacterium]|nr:restriction endonuclease subunit S [Bacillota bacterium]